MNQFKAHQHLAVACVSLAAVSALSGCQTSARKPSTQATTAPTLLSLTIKQIGDGDARATPAAMVRLVIFMLDLPPGSVSENSEFWKRVDEQAVGAANHDRLLRNGIRCGIVPLSESLFFSHFFDNQPHALSVSHVDALHTETFPLPMDKPFDRQDLFFFNASDQLEGRSYDCGTNRLMLSFGPTPRDPNAVRLTLCSVVASQKMQLDYTPLNQEFQTPIKDEERIYDLGLTVDVPDGSFFIIAPGGDAQRATSMGGVFFTRGDKTDRKERTIVIVPTLLRTDGKPARVRDLIFR